MKKKLLLVFLFFTYTVYIQAQDTTPPVITCPASVTLECGSDTTPTGAGIATATDDTDPNPVITFTDATVPGCGFSGTISRTWTATDASGNSASCVQTIAVVDTTPPTISCPADITLECGSGGSTTTTGTTTGTNSGNNAIPDNDINGISVPAFVSGIP